MGHLLLPCCFSGQRRPGDYEDWLNQSLAVSPFPACAISLDVAIDATLCDLSSGDVVGRWLNMALSRLLERRL